LTGFFVIRLEALPPHQVPKMSWRFSHHDITCSDLPSSEDDNLRGILSILA
jgi:hypothetical protein